MRVIVDNKIPFIKEAIEKIADSVIYTPGRDFTPELVKDADALIIRTRTHCNKELLEGIDEVMPQVEEAVRLAENNPFRCVPVVVFQLLPLSRKCWESSLY